MWSALGVAVSDVSHICQEPRSFRFPILADPINEIFARLEHHTLETLEDEGLAELAANIGRSVRMKYCMQVHDIEVPGGPRTLDDISVATIDSDFGDTHEALFGEGSGYREGGVEITAFQVRADCVTDKPSFARHVASEGGLSRATRSVYWAEPGESVETPVVRLERRTFSETMSGPALVELPDTVVVVRPGQSAVFDDIGDLIVDTGA